MKEILVCDLSDYGNFLEHFSSSFTRSLNRIQTMRPQERLNVETPFGSLKLYFLTTLRRAPDTIRTLLVILILSSILPFGLVSYHASLSINGDLAPSLAQWVHCSWCFPLTSSTTRASSNAAAWHCRYTYTNIDVEKNIL